MESEYNEHFASDYIIYVILGNACIKSHVFVYKSNPAKITRNMVQNTEVNPSLSFAHWAVAAALFTSYP